MTRNITIGVLLLSAFQPLVSAACTREKLLADANTYVAAQSSGKLDDLKKLFSSNFTYDENNGGVKDLAKGILSQGPLKVDYNRSTADTVACASYTELVVATGPKPYVIGTQLRHAPDGSISKVDTIAATTGALFFNATATLGYFQKVPNSL